MIFELFVSPDSDPDFAPQLAILGPGIAPSGKLPNGMNPQGLPASLHSGVRNKEPDLEPATPARQYFLLRTEFPAPNSGKYYAVVFSGIVGGKFGLAIGAMESFTLLEWIRIPLAVIGTYRWEGQSIALVFLPFVLILTFGLLIMLTRQKLNDWAIRLGVLAGWIFLGSAALYGTQVLFKIVSARAAEKWLLLFPFVILLTQILLAIGVMRSSLRKKPVRTAIYGFLGLIAWAGYIVGPTMAVLSAVAIASRAKQRAWKV